MFYLMTSVQLLRCLSLAFPPSIKDVIMRTNKIPSHPSWPFMPWNTHFRPSVGADLLCPSPLYRPFSGAPISRFISLKYINKREHPRFSLQMTSIFFHSRDNFKDVCSQVWRPRTQILWTSTAFIHQHVVSMTYITQHIVKNQAFYIEFLCQSHKVHTQHNHIITVTNLLSMSSLLIHT